MLDCEVSLDSEFFDPAVREGLSEFFKKALARNYRARYDNAEEMRRAWFRVFEHIDRPASTTDPGEAVDIDAMLEEATEATPLVALGLRARILNAVDRMGVHTLGELAVAEPLLAPIRAAEALSSLPAPEGDRPIPPDRLVRLAVRASEQAALSSRMEIYPKGMPAPRALKLGMGSFLGPKAVTVQQIQQRIGSRYPEAAPIPGPPHLTRLLTEAGSELVWNGQSRHYAPKLRRPGDPSATSTLPRFSTASQPGATPTPEVADARALEERIRRAVEHRRFLVLSVALRHLLRAERELLGRFPLRRVSIEGLLIEQMKSLVGQAGASWEVVLRADATERCEGNDWRNLMTLVRRAVPPLEQALLRLEQPALLV
jgi:hypothetical protein